MNEYGKIDSLSLASQLFDISDEIVNLLDGNEQEWMKEQYDDQRGRLNEFLFNAQGNLIRALLMLTYQPAYVRDFKQEETKQSKTKKGKK